MQTLHDAVQALADRGFVSQVVDVADGYILGGKECEYVGRVPVYQYPFRIERQGDAWIVAIAVPGQSDRNLVLPTLADAVSAVEQI